MGSPAGCATLGKFHVPYEPENRGQTHPLHRDDAELGQGCREGGRDPWAGSGLWPGHSSGLGQEPFPWLCHLGLDGLLSLSFPTCRQEGRSPCSAGVWGGLPGRRWLPARPTSPLERPRGHSPHGAALDAAHVLPRGSQAGSQYLLGRDTWPAPSRPRPPTRAEPSNQRSTSSAPPPQPANPQAKLLRPP